MSPRPASARGCPSNLTLPTLPMAALLLLLAGCATRRPGTTTAPDSWRDWQARRQQSVAGPEGWTTVVGLHWIGEGRHGVGPSDGDAIRVPEGGPRGVLGRSGTNVWFEPAPGYPVEVAARTTSQRIPLAPDQPGPPTRIARGPHQLWILRRGDRWAVRLRDASARARREFPGLRYFPWSARWQVPARLEPHPPGHTLPITDVTGTTRAEPNPGVLVFSLDGREHRLEALEDAEAGDLFILFRDDTNGSSTYAPGRFLHAPLPDARGRTVLDFNQAYNPPCAFTDFATCPRPPAGNRLPLAVTAGERKPAAAPPGRRPGTPDPGPGVQRRPE